MIETNDPVKGPIPPDEREPLPDGWLSVYNGFDYTVAQLERAARLYLAGHSCSDCQVKTGVNAEQLRKILSDLGLIRSMSEAQTVRYLRQRRHVKRLLESPVDYGTAAICRLTGLGKRAVIGYRRDWTRGLPITEWTSS